MHWMSTTTVDVSDHLQSIAFDGSAMADVYCSNMQNLVCVTVVVNDDIAVTGSTMDKGSGSGDWWYSTAKDCGG